MVSIEIDMETYVIDCLTNPENRVFLKITKCIK